LKPQTIEELAKELGYSRRHMRDIARDMVAKGEWQLVKVRANIFVNAYIRKKKK